jgi:hypothetical protein
MDLPELECAGRACQTPLESSVALDLNASNPPDTSPCLGGLPLGELQQLAVVGAGASLPVGDRHQITRSGVSGNPPPATNRKAEDGESRQIRNDPGLLTTGRGRFGCWHNVAGQMTSGTRPNLAGKACAGSSLAADAATGPPAPVSQAGASTPARSSKLSWSFLSC